MVIMKCYKLYSLLAGVMLLAACSSEEPALNVNEATVSMKESYVIMKETAGISYLPVVVTGERSGNVEVTISLVPAESNGAKEDVDYVATTKRLVISPDQTSVDIEIHPMDDDEINGDRTFDIVLADAQGATIGTANKTTVTIHDNDGDYYERMAGRWRFTGVDANTGDEVSFSVKVTEGSGEAYGQYYVCTSNNGFDIAGDAPWMFSFRMKFDYNEADNRVEMSIVTGEVVASWSAYTIKFQKMTIDGVSPDNYKGTYDEETKTITFESGNLVGQMYGNDVYMTSKFKLYECSMIRI